MNPNISTMEVRRLTEADLPVFKSLIELFNTVFEEDRSNMGNDTTLVRLLGDDRFIAMVAIHEDDVTGGLTAYILPKYYSDSSEVLLYDMAVKPENQRMGIGKKLIQTLKEYCSSKGIQEFFVMAHEEDGHAIEFYRSTGGTGENVVNFLYETGEDRTHQEAL